MKIGFFTDLFYPYVGGNEAYLVNLETRLVKKGIEVVHLTTKLPNTKSFEIYNGIKIYRLPIFTKDFMKGRFIFPFLSFLKNKVFKDVDLIQATTYPASITAWLIGKLLKKPTILFCHEFFRDYWNYMRVNIFSKKIYPKIENYIAKCPYDWFICPSLFSKKALIDAGSFEEKISVIYHGIDQIFKPNIKSELRKELNLEDKHVFGYCGRLYDYGQKGMLYLLKATKYVVNEIENSILLLMGTGFEKIEPFIKKLNLEKNIIYIGYKPYKEIPKFYAACDIVVGASLTEGFGFMYAEASRCGKAVVATNVGSIPEIIINGKTGILVPPMDSKALAEAIIELLINKKKAKKMGKEGSKYTKKFTWEKSVKEHIRVYCNVLEAI
ncbi:MAG: glycosyltransferase family 4 protein [Candidatus Aenigmatarchaeota archaeon]